MAPQALREEQDKQESAKALRFLIRKEKPAPHPATPTVEEPPEVS